MRWILHPMQGGSVRNLAGVALLAQLLACGGGSVEPATVVEPAPEAPETPDLSVEDLKKDADNAALVPSTIETQRALEAAGIETQLATLIPQHKFDTTGSDTDAIAVRTGVILADLLLTVKTAESAKMLEHLDLIQKGMAQLGGGKDIDATLSDLRERVEADAVTRDELLKEFDELSGAVVPELEFSGNQRIVPLIQAGSWLEGANLVARAVEQSGKFGSADTLLKQPDVVDYFIRYVRTEGSDKAPEAVTAKLDESLTSLRDLAAKSEALTAEDIAVVTKVTNDVLSLL